MHFKQGHQSSLNRSLLLVLVSQASLCLTSCGSSATIRTEVPSNAPSVVPSGSYWKNDGDSDDQYPPRAHAELDNESVLNVYKHTADASETSAISDTVKRYYAAASAEKGEIVCSLLYRDFAAQLGGGRRQSGSSALQACAMAVARQLANQHKQLMTQEVSTMTVTGARLNGDIGLALLGFRHMPENVILIEREGRVWKVGQLFGDELP